MSDGIICVSVKPPHCYLEVKFSLECSQNLSRENLDLQKKHQRVHRKINHREAKFLS